MGLIVAYSLARINIREFKSDVSTGEQVYDLLDGLIPIEIDGYTKLADDTTPTAGEFSYFPSTKQLKLNNSVVDADLYVTYSLIIGNKTTTPYYPIDPTQNTGDKYKWVPWMGKAPVVTESAKNILEGIISYNSLTIDIQSGTDRALRKYFGSNFSVMNQEFKLYRAANDGEPVCIYTGIGTGVDFDAVSVKYKCNAKIKELDEPAYYGFNQDYLDPSFQYRNIWYQTGDMENMPILCASIIPYTQIYGEVQDNPNGTTINGRYISHYTFDKSILPAAKGSWGASSLYFCSGITFGDWNSSNYSQSAGFSLHGPPITLLDEISIGSAAVTLNLKSIIQGRLIYGVPTYTIQPHPLDHGYFDGSASKKAVIMNTTLDWSNLTGDVFGGSFYKSDAILVNGTSFAVY